MRRRSRSNPRWLPLLEQIDRCMDAGRAGRPPRRHGDMARSQASPWNDKKAATAPPLGRQGRGRVSPHLVRSQSARRSQTVVAVQRPPTLFLQFRGGAGGEGAGRQGAGTTTRLTGRLVSHMCSDAKIDPATAAVPSSWSRVEGGPASLSRSKHPLQARSNDQDLSPVVGPSGVEVCESHLLMVRSRTCISVRPDPPSRWMATRSS